MKSTRVILSAAKNLVARHEILRFAQDDSAGPQRIVR